MNPNADLSIDHHMPETAILSRPRTGLSAREMFVGRMADQNRALAQIKLTAAQDRDLRLIAENEGHGVTKQMMQKLSALGLIDTPPFTVEHLATPGTWPGSRLSGLGQAYIRRGSKGGK